MQLVYSAFISYNHRDKPWALWLHRALETYRIPKSVRGRDSPLGIIGKRLPPVFRDRDELGASSDLGAAVRQALEASVNLVVILSPASAQSRWVNEEVDYFIALGRRDRIRCLIVDGVPNSIDPAIECLPVSLRGKPGEEPLAADPRVDGDGKRGALVKLVAGMLDLPYDELRQRDAARRQRVLAVIAAGSIAGLVVTSGLAVTAWLARNEAIAQAEIARKRTLTAERTVGFVKSLFAVADPSEARGETITVREVLDKGSGRLKSELAREPSVRTDLTLTLSEVYSSLGLYRQSNSLIREAFAIDVRDRTVEARRWAALGEARLRDSDYARSIRAFAKVARDPTAEGATRARAFAGMSQALNAIEAFDEARLAGLAALRFDRAQMPLDPSAIARDIEVLGSNEYYAGNLEAAEKIIKRALDVRTKTEGDASPSVSDNLNTLASIAIERGDARTAEGYFRKNLVSDEKVLGPEHPDIATTLNNLARLLLERRAFAEALPMLERAARIASSEKRQTHDDLAFVYMNLGIARRFGGQGDARTSFERGLTAATLHRHRTRGPILGEIADLDCANGKASGLAKADQAAGYIAADYEADDWRAAWIGHVRAGCLAVAGRRADAENLFRRTAPALQARWAANSHYGAEAMARRSRAR